MQERQWDLWLKRSSRAQQASRQKQNRCDKSDRGRKGRRRETEGQADEPDHGKEDNGQQSHRPTDRQQKTPAHECEKKFHNEKKPATNQFPIGFSLFPPAAFHCARRTSTTLSTFVTPRQGKLLQNYPFREASRASRSCWLRRLKTPKPDGTSAPHGGR